MLGKLAFRNAKRSLKDYMIYLITITISFSLIFAFNLVSSSDAVLELSLGMSTFKNVMLFVNVIIIFVVCFLINYTTKFMFDKRSKELGMYMLLGIKRKEILKMFVLENLILGFSAMLLSIPGGYILSQFVSLIIVNILDIPEVIFISFDFVSVQLLVFYFLAIYVLVLLNMFLKIKKMTVHHLLYLDKQNEKKMFRSSKNRNIIFVVSLIIGLLSFFVWHSRFSIDIVEKQETLTYLMLCITGVILSIYGISATMGDMALSLMLRSKSIKYKKDNLFVARTYASKARTMSFTIGTLSMLALFSLLALNISSLTKGLYDYTINTEAPYDVSLFDDKNKFEEYIEIINEDYTINEILKYDIYIEPENQLQPLIDHFKDFDSVLRLSDYQELLRIRGFDSVELSEKEYLIVVSNQLEYKFKDNIHIKKLKLASGAELRLKEIDTKTFWYTINNNSPFVMVLPDRYVNDLEVSESHLIVDTEEETTASLEKKIEEQMSYHLCKTDDEGEVSNEYYRIMVRGAAVEEQNTATAIVSSVCLYLAFIFVAVVGTIFAVQSLSDSTKYRYRYLTLRRIGVNDITLYKSIRKQLYILFGLPIGYSIIVCFCMVVSINKVYGLFLASKNSWLLYFAGGLAVFLLIYAVYWITTYIGFKRNINGEC